MRDHGQPVIDLENLANHMGSAFGGIGRGDQPSQEHFENLLAIELSVVQHIGEYFWVENESRFIGRLRLPDTFFNQFPASPFIEIELDIEKRIENIIRDYGSFDTEILVDRTRTLAKRMGLEHVNKACEFLMNGDQIAWIKILLHYYDNAYTHSNERAKITGKFQLLMVDETTTVNDFVEKKFKLDGQF